MRPELGYTVYRGFQEWIPKSDISWAVAKDNAVSKAINVDFVNGKIVTAKQPLLLMTTTSDYIGYARFYDSLYGNCELFVMRAMDVDSFDPEYRFDEPTEEEFVEHESLSDGLPNAGAIYYYIKKQDGTWTAVEHGFPVVSNIVANANLITSKDVTIVVADECIYVSINNASIAFQGMQIPFSFVIARPKVGREGALGSDNYNVSVDTFYSSLRWGLLVYNHYNNLPYSYFKIGFLNPYPAIQDQKFEDVANNAIIDSGPPEEDGGFKVIPSACYTKHNLYSYGSLLTNKYRFQIGSWTSYLTPDGSPRVQGAGYIKFTKLYAFSSVDIVLAYNKANTNSGYGRVVLEIRDTASQELLAEKTEIMTNAKVHGYTKHTISTNDFFRNVDVYVHFQFFESTDALVDFSLDSISFNGINHLQKALIAVNDTGERYLVNTSILYTEGGTTFYRFIPIFADSIYYRTTKEYFDHRIGKLEFYFEKIKNIPLALIGEFELYATADLDGYVKLPLNTDVSEVLTLNFSYGFGPTVLVDSYCNVADEVIYGNRSYFVSGDNKVRHTHISGYGKHMGTVFAYNEELNYGYFELSSLDKGSALAVTNSNDLLVLTDRNAYLYYIQQGSSNQALKALRLLQAGKGIANKAILKNNFGKSACEVICWANPSGVYIYAGGNEFPKDITEQKLKNYLMGRTVTHIGYNHKKDELLIFLNTGNTIAYSLYSDVFKEYSFNSPIFVNQDRYLDASRHLYSVSEATAYFPSSTVEFHDSADTIVGRDGQYIKLSVDVIKVLQDIYLSGTFPEGTGVSLIVSNAGIPLYTYTLTVGGVDQKSSIKIMSKIGTSYLRLGVQLGFAGPITLDEMLYRFNTTYKGLGQHQ